MLMMTIRITTLTETTRTVIKIDGRLKSADLEELGQLLRGVRGLMELDVSELQSIDRDAAIVLQELIEAGVELRSVSPFVELMLRSESNHLRRSDAESSGE